MPPRCFNHRGRAPSRPCPFLTQKWYRPGARSPRAALDTWRPNAEGSQRVATVWATGPPTT